MDRLNATAKNYNMKLNVKKTKTKIVARKGRGTVSIVVEGQRVEQVKKFKYLWSVIAEDGRCVEDIKQRIVCSKKAFNKRRELLSKSMIKALKKRIVKMPVWALVLYGYETWGMSKEVIPRLEAFEMRGGEGWRK